MRAWTGAAGRDRLEHLCRLAHRRVEVLPDLLYIFYAREGSLNSDLHLVDEYLLLEEALEAYWNMLPEADRKDAESLAETWRRRA